MAKQVVQKNDDADQLKSVILYALNSSESVKACFKPGDLSLGRGQNTYAVVMQNGSAYRVDIRITRAAE